MTKKDLMETVGLSVAAAERTAITAGVRLAVTVIRDLGAKWIAKIKKRRVSRKRSRLHTIPL